MANITMRNQTIIFLVLVVQFLVLFCHADSIITQDRMLRDGDTLISDNEMFELGFFNPEGSTSRYVGIWYYKIHPRSSSVVWIANRDKPVSDRSGTMKIRQDGNLVIEDGRNITVWSSGNASVRVNSPMAKLLDSGNLVLSRSDDIEDANRAYWQSFNHPTDTFLPGMRFQFSESMGERRAFFSWKSLNDPSLGNYSMGVDPRGAPQVVIWRGSERHWRSGYWDNQKFNGVPSMSSIISYGFDFTREGGGNYSFKYIPPRGSDVMRFRISWNGFEEQLKWNEDNQKWDLTQSQPASHCDHYNNCGNFGVCRNHSVNICSCIDGFEAKPQDRFTERNWAGGCIRKVPLGCPKNSSIEDGGGDGFKAIKNVKLPDFGNMVTARNGVECRDICLRNCSCTAYAYEDGINCFLWTGELIDVQQFPSDAVTLNLRLAASELGGRGKVSTVLIIIITVAGTTLLAIVAWIIWRIISKPRGKASSSFIPHRNNMEAPSHDLTKSNEYSAELSGANEFVMEGDQGNGPELPVFSFGYVASVTNNFSEENKLGKGGFGPVYKGKLPGGQEIAVKRLSRRSGQGIEEFKNEIKLIAKLQHRNLVRLLGCCVEGEEYMLVYEYMPNKSLDFFVFDSAKRELLDWTKRFAIIEGIARGLLYLHRDSRLRIIHRDLKASNILLDEDMIPKISDFGIARIFGGNENEANTVRVVGTYGYMSPEYAMEGLFSVKSDVYSFGVLLLEIVSGQRNTSFRTSEHSSLIGYAWKLWNEGRALEMVDPTIKESCSENEVLRCIHIGMLCVQDSALSRPTMSYVVVMLESEDTSLPIPRQPTYTSMRSSSVDIESYIENHDSATMNELTMTSIHGR